MKKDPKIVYVEEKKLYSLKWKKVGEWIFLILKPFARLTRSLVYFLIILIAIRVGVITEGVALWTLLGFISFLYEFTKDMRFELWQE